jgi:hypothetical protein
MLRPSRCHAELVSASLQVRVISASPLQNSELYTPNSKQSPLDIFNNHDILHLKIYILDLSPYKF